MADPDLEKERQRFEAEVAKKPGYQVFNKEFVLPGVYANPFVQAAWEGWQARAHLAVPAQELCPKCFGKMEPHGQCSQCGEYPEEPVKFFADNADLKRAVTQMVNSPTVKQSAVPADGGEATLEIRDNHVSGAIPVETQVTQNYTAWASRGEEEYQRGLSELREWANMEILEYLPHRAEWNRALEAVIAKCDDLMKEIK